MSEQQENRDYEHKQSVRDCVSIASQTAEEKPKPSAAQESFPVWLLIVCVAVLIVGGSYVGANSGGFEFANHNKSGYEPSVPVGISGKAPELSEFEKYIKGGEAVYRAVCNGCHQATGSWEWSDPASCRFRVGHERDRTFCSDSFEWHSRPNNGEGCFLRRSGNASTERGIKGQTNCTGNDLRSMEVW